MKMAKRSLAVLLALMMAFSVFSLIGSAAVVNKTTTVTGIDGHGSVKYALNIYKDIDGKSTLLADGALVSPGDVLDVHLAFSTDFYMAQLYTQIMYDSTYFEPWAGTAAYNGAAATSGFKNAFLDGYISNLPGVPEYTYSDGVTKGTLFDCLMKDDNGGRIGQVDTFADRTSRTNQTIILQNYPLSWHKDSNMRNAISADYEKYRSIVIQLGCGPKSATNGGTDLMKVPFGEYFSFKLHVKADTDTNGKAIAPIFISPDSAKKASSDPKCQLLFAGPCTSEVYDSANCVGLGFGQTIDLTDAERDFIIGKPACSHDWGEGVVTTEATCTEDGVRTFTCSKCTETKTEPEAKLGHDYQPVVTEPTCTEDGYTTYTCSRCPDSYTADTVEKLGHDWNEGTVTKEPTCQDGEKTFTCSRCPETRKEPIPGTGEHEWGDWSETLAPTCGEPGEKTRTCKNCTETDTLPIPATGEHECDAVVTNPTCTEQGYTTYSCKNCTYSYVDDYVDALNHKNAAAGEALDPTCTVAGHTAGKYCPDCKTWIVPQETIPATNHKNAYDGEALAPTCTAAGHTAGKYCPDCETWIEEQANIPAINHKNAYAGEALDPTCTEPGHTAGKYCPDCETWIEKQANIPAINHKNAYDGEALDPTCTVAGHTAGKYCPDCETWIVPQETIKANDHVFGEWVETKPATEDEEGEETRYCANCEAFETRPIAKLAPAVLTLKESVRGTEGEIISATATYTRKGQVAVALTASEEGVTYAINDKRDAKSLTVDENGNVKFVRMTLFHRNAVVTATSADGERVATCQITVKYKWWQYLLWIIFGCLWF